MDQRNSILEPLLELEPYQALLRSIKEHNTPVATTGVLDSQKCHLVYANLVQGKRPVMIIAHNELRAKEIYEDMQFLTKGKVLFYPSKDIIFYSADVHSVDIVKQRLSVLEALLKEEQPVIVLSVEALLDRLVKKEIFETFALAFEVGDMVPIDDLASRLIFMGYERVELVEGPGQFAFRGGILDIYPVSAEHPYRIEFWDDEIDSIRIVDVSTQRSIEKVQGIDIFPMRELVFEKEKIQYAMARIQEETEQILHAMSKNDTKEQKENLQKMVSTLLEKLKEQKTFRGIEGYIQYFYEDTVSLTDYISKDTVIYVDEPVRVSQKCTKVIEEFEESMKGRLEKGFLLPSQVDVIFRYEEMMNQILAFDVVLMTTLAQGMKNFPIKENIHFSVKSIGSFYRQMEVMEKDLRYWKEKKYRILIFAGPRTRAERLQKELQERNLEAVYRPELNKPIQKGEIVIAHGSLQKGFEYGMIDFVVISDKEVFGETKKKRKVKKKKRGAKIESFTDLSVGDHVVHENHGIGVFRGIEKIVVDNVSKDYLKIHYADNGILYVPISQMDMVQKYIGAESRGPKLNKLGGNEWNKAKAKVKKAVVDLAKDLIALYAKRQATKGFIYSEDTVWQKEFEDMFPYEETEDQLDAIEEIKKDMQSTKVMDRLLCGDVGYGKTEVAIRGAFKAVQDGKQVAYLVPTTILAQQHYNTFAQRMKDFPITVGLLSRFRTPKQQKETIENLKRGLVDIVIGTHRILSKDIQYKDLGLLIVDEEQRFGVAHKEKLKQLKKNVDVLTLTATPIPRTLHMSMVGIRDMSVLEEPPEERFPVQTYVMEYNTEFIKDAIHRELSRDGQVYYLHNRVKNIDKVAAKIQRMVPEAVVSFAHGQMSERELENIMMDFINGEIDVLVCTTIIETGMDISNVNTIIIEDADHMGLSQLYQLRGRVGRSNRIAYAYLMYKKDKVLQEVAEKRLQAIKEFTEFGSGFKIAMRDLEIRGAGNLLGAQQHGHMESVGYDLYCKLLDEAVKQEKGETVEEAFETSIEIDISAYIPSTYIKDEMQKLEIYKKIASIQTQQDFYDIQEEVEDRYGDLPKSVANLLEVSYLKAKAHEIGILSIVQKGSRLVITFKRDAKINPVLIPELLKRYRRKLSFAAGETPFFTYQLTDVNKNQLIRQIKNVLHDMKNLKL